METRCQRAVILGRDRIQSKHNSVLGAATTAIPGSRITASMREELHWLAIAEGDAKTSKQYCPSAKRSYVIPIKNLGSAATCDVIETDQPLLLLVVLKARRFMAVQQFGKAMMGP